MVVDGGPVMVRMLESWSNLCALYEPRSLDPFA